MTRELTADELKWLREAWREPGTGIREIYRHLKIGGPTLMRLRDDLGLGNKGNSRRALNVFKGERRSPAAVRAPPPAISPEYEAMLRRVAVWDQAAATGLASIERQRAEAAIVRAAA